MIDAVLETRWKSASTRHTINEAPPGQLVGGLHAMNQLDHFFERIHLQPAIIW
jgi:hypothetical protein